MKPLQTSSGHLLADRRADYAQMLFASGSHAAAAELLLGALELAPDWSFGWFRLGEFHEAAGDLVQAVEAWRMALKLDPADRVGASLKLQLAGAEPADSVLSSGFVEALFDQYAGTFDRSLVEKLGYRAPELLLDAIRAEAPGRFDLVIDLGCGTGLMGERLRPFAGRLEGYDISAEMLRKAGSKKIYDWLVKADLLTMRYGGDPVGLVVAADVFIYLGALETVFALAAAMLAPGGLFAFSVERHAGEGDFALRPTRRHAHAEPYIRRGLEEAGFAVLSLDGRVIRQDHGEPVEGLVAVARRS